MTTILLGTRKGLLTLERSASGYRTTDVAHQGIPVQYAMTSRSGATWASLDHGHWGPKLARKDPGRDWEPVEVPSVGDGETTVAGVWLLADGHAHRDGELWLGTFPGALFRSSDQGRSFDLIDGLWHHPTKSSWFGGGVDVPGIHSLCVDPRDPDHLYVGVSVGGVYETTDGAKSWRARNVGLPADFLPDPTVEAGHDPHLLAMVASAPDVIWQQNHCGIERTTDGARQWVEVSEPSGPARFGFAIAVRDDDPDVAWVVPAVSDEKRNAVDGRLMVCRTEDGGRSWQQLTAGLPQRDVYDVVYRHALDRRGDELVFGSTTGNAYWSGDGGDSWTCLGTNFPPIYSARFAG